MLFKSCWNLKRRKKQHTIQPGLLGKKKHANKKYIYKKV